MQFQEQLIWIASVFPVVLSRGQESGYNNAKFLALDYRWRSLPVRAARRQATGKIN